MMFLGYNSWRRSLMAMLHGLALPHVTFVLCEWHLSELTYRCLLATFMAAFRCSPKVQFALAVWGNL